MQAKKSFGQNFLMHRQIAERIVIAAGINAEDTVLEIGPGTGMLTQVLLEKAAKVVAVESDADLLPGLQERFASEIDTGKLELILADIRSFDAAMRSLQPTYKIVANIPYYITGELLRKFLTTTNKPATITFLVQKEVAIRIARSKKESLLSLSVKAFGKPAYCFTVPRGAFKPAPNVDSAVLTIREISSPFSSPEAEAGFFEMLHAGFAQKRKQLLNNLGIHFPPENVRKAFEKLLIPQKIRAEDVPLDTWLTLSEIVHS
jgi:16S rRNA (adenine1518-N6/adenine1519-N6)-dimethyltransferase